MEGDTMLVDAQKPVSELDEHTRTAAPSVPDHPEQEPVATKSKAPEAAPEKESAMAAIPPVESTTSVSLLLQSDHMAIDEPVPGPQPTAPAVEPAPTPQTPQEPQTPAIPERQLNVTDALTYLDAVKTQFADQSDVYNRFLDIMKEFKSQTIDTPGVIRRVSHLFHGHPVLIQGFNTFLPPGYRIECAIDANDNQVIVTTVGPSGETVTESQRTDQKTVGQPLDEPMVVDPVQEPEPPKVQVQVQVEAPPPPPPPPHRPSPSATASDGPDIEPALQYVQKIKQRCDGETYREFLDILARYHHHQDNVDQEDVSRRIARLFKDDPELHEEFRVFMPYGDLVRKSRAGSPEIKHKRKYDENTGAIAPASTTKRAKRKDKERERISEREKEVYSKPPSTSHARKQQRHAPLHDTTYHPLPPSGKYINHISPPDRRIQYASQPIPHQIRPPVHDDLQFFDRVKRTLDNRETYNEFLKVVNLFTQGYIDTARLLERSQSFLVGDGSLMRQWRDILGWDERKEREYQAREAQQQFGWSRPSIAGYQDRPTRADLTSKYGSYRRLPASEVNVPCSGRDEMCRDVLNDEWVSHMANEDVGFFSPPRNIYEEALHRSEEERHEYDFFIDALCRTIGILEPINNKMSLLNPEERGNFKLKPNLNGAAKAIHYRIIKKIYGREAGSTVMQNMQDSPALAIPVVLNRLKQKEEEWKRAQRAWIRVWREVDAKNYARSLDYQNVSFKTLDKKATQPKTFVSQIEAAREEQLSKRAVLVDPLFSRTRPRHQLEFAVEDFSVVQDGLKLVFSFLDRVQGQVNLAQRRRIEVFLRSFVPMFFMLNSTAFNDAFVAVVTTGSDGGGGGPGGVESDVSDVDVGSNPEEEVPAPTTNGNTNGNGTSTKKGRKSGGSGGGGVAGASNGNGDLRKKLLKSEQAKFSIRKTFRASQHDVGGGETGLAGSSSSRPQSPALFDEELNSSNKRFSQRNAFFTNTHFYVFLRTLEVLYTRLGLFKGLAKKLGEEFATTGAYPTSHLGLEPPEFLKIGGGDQQQTVNPAAYYDLMLEACELVLDNQVDPFVFEDQMRYMFGIQDAYKIFTIDKLISALIKAVQNIFLDPKSQDLLDILKCDRSTTSPTEQDILNSRRAAEKIVGPDENLFRIDWIPEGKMMTFQLLGKESSEFEDSEVLTERWLKYVEEYGEAAPTEGIPEAKAKLPFLNRNLPRQRPWQKPHMVCDERLEFKICVRTYRLFYVPNTEDYLCNISSPVPKS